MDMLALAALDALLKIIWPPFAAAKLCETLLLLMTPVPLRISSPPDAPNGETCKVKEAESEANTMLFTSSDVETFTSLCEE